MMKAEQILAVDLGNGETCWKTSDGSGSFRSLIAGASSQSYDVDPDMIKVGNKRYMVGDRCVTEEVETGSTDTSYYRSDRIKILFLSVLKKAGIKNPYVVTGLPTEFYESERNNFAENLKRWAREENYQIDGIKVLPQHIGPILDSGMKDKEGQVLAPSSLRGAVGIIDIGQGTIDVGQIWDGRPSEKSWGENKGVSDIHKAVLTLLKSPDNKRKGKNSIPERLAMDSQLNIHRVNSFFREGYIPFRGEKLDIWAITKEERLKFAKAHIGRAINEMWGITDTLDGMIVAGGGAIVLGREILEEIIHCPIYIPENPSMSIVNGFYNVMARSVKG